MTRAWLLFIFGLAACQPAPRASSADHRRSAAESQRGPIDAPAEPARSTVLERLALVVTQRLPEPGEIARLATDAGPDPLARYIDTLVRDPQFAAEVAPAMLSVLGAQHATGYLLQQTGAPDGSPIYYLRRPCAVEIAETVQPWWAATTTVRVCPEAHRPDYLSQPGTDWQCGSAKLNLVNDENRCGCGPHLARCFRDTAQREAIRASLRAENARTIAWVIDHDLPIETLFTSNATFRDYNAELVYTNWRVLDGEDVAYPVAADWPRDGTWAPRHERRPGMHAGILTTPHTLWNADATRTLLRQIYDLLWCKSPESSQVDAHTIWSLGVTDLRRGDGWQQLAAMPVCTRCHARLDHGAQFFTGFPGTLLADHYTAALQQSGPGPLYGDDIDDPRGSAERTPLAFAQFVTAQDEFAACMVQRVGRRVFGGRPAIEDERAMREAFDRAHNIRDVARMAMHRAAALWQRAPRPALAPAPSSTASDATGDLRLPSALRADLEQACGECHADGPHAFTAQPVLARPMVERMLRAIAFEQMPRDTAALPAAPRRAIVRALIAELYRAPASRAAALEMFDATPRRRAPLSEAARLAAVHARTGLPAAAWPAQDLAYGRASSTAPPTDSPLSPTIAVDLAASALADCAKLDAADRAACLDRALPLDALMTPDVE